MHAKSGGSSGEPPDFLFIPAACRSRKDLPRSAGGAGRGTRATVRGTQKTEPRARARGAGRGRRGHGHGRRVRGRGCGVRGTGAEHGRRGRGAQDAKRGTRGRGRGHGHGHGGTGCRTQDAGRRTQNTGYWPRAAEHGKRGHEVQKTEDAGTGCRTQNTGYWPRAAEHGKRGRGAQETGHRRRGTSPRAWTAARPHTPRQAPQQPAWTVHSRAPSAAGTNPPGPFTAGRPPPGPATTRRAIHSRAPSATGTCNNPPGPSTAGRLPPRAAATCRAYESESRRCRRARRTCCCRAAPRPT